MSTKYVQKAPCFDESQCKYADKIDQETPTSSASQFKEPGLYRKVTNENMFPSNFKRRKWDDDYIQYGFFLPRNGESSH